MTPLVALANREIRDLVYRCCRVAGCDAGIADRLAANILHAEIHRGEGLQTFVGAMAEGPDRVAELAAAADLIEQGEVDARLHELAIVSLVFPVPLAALSQTLWNAAVRGVGAASLSLDATGGEVLAAVELRREPLANAVRARAEARQAEAFQHGILVPRSVFAQIEDAAGSFLVSEATLDGLA